MASLEELREELTRAIAAAEQPPAFDASALEGQEELPLTVKNLYYSILSDNRTYSYAYDLTAELGADGLLLITPYYNKTNEEGMVRHFTTVADAVNIPCILYNVPGRTGCSISEAAIRRLAAHPRIMGIKEASGNIAQVAQIAAACGDALNIYSGNDDQVLPLLSLGGKGVISVVSNIAPTLVHDCCKAWFDGDAAEARRLQLEILPLCDAMFCDVNPIPVKYAMNLLGWQAGKCRLPLVEPDDAKKAKIEQTLREHGLLS